MKPSTKTTSWPLMGRSPGQVFHSLIIILLQPPSDCLGSCIKQTPSTPRRSSPSASPQTSRLKKEKTSQRSAFKRKEGTEKAKSDRKPLVDGNDVIAHLISVLSNCSTHGSNPSAINTSMVAICSHHHPMASIRGSEGCFS